jgi:hypothetical protein
VKAGFAKLTQGVQADLILSQGRIAERAGEDSANCLYYLSAKRLLTN